MCNSNSIIKDSTKNINKQDYKGDTHDETPDFSTKYTNIFKKDDDSLKSNLDKEEKI